MDDQPTALALEDDCEDCTDDFADLVEALARAQGAFTVPKRTKTAKAGSYSYTYASLDDIIAACRPALNAEGITLTQDVVNRGASVTVTTTLRRRSAALEFGPFELPVPDASPQSFGSAMTYARRYALSTALGIAAEEDDDAGAASPRREAPGSPKVAPAKMKHLHGLAKQKGITHEGMRDWAGRHLGIASLAELTVKGAEEMEAALSVLADVAEDATAVAGAL